MISFKREFQIREKLTHESDEMNFIQDRFEKWFARNYRVSLAGEVVYSTIYQTAGHIPWNASQPQIFDDLFAITFFIFCLFIN